MPDLAEDLRAIAPEPDEAFLARLEQRVEAGFAQPKRRPRRVSLFKPAFALAATVALVGLIAIPVALNDSGSSDDSGSGGGSAPPQPAMSQDAAGGGSASSAAEVAPAPTRRVVERSTQLELAPSSDEFDETTDGVLRVADEAGAIVQRSNVTQREGRGYASYDLRVPASRLDTTMAELSRLAHVSSRSASSDDITGSYVSARERLRDARDEREALLKALANATTDAEVEALKQRLRDARLRITAHKAEVERIRARGQRARVQVTVESTGKRSEGGPWTPGDAIGDAVRVLEVAAGVLVVGAAFLVPFAALALLGLLGARVLRRRRREAVLG
jgi:hypothetical protein